MMLSKQERRAAAIYEATGALYKAAEGAGLTPAEVLSAVGAARQAARKEGPLQKCSTCPWRRDGLEHCVLPNCMKGKD